MDYTLSALHRELISAAKLGNNNDTKGVSEAENTFKKL